MLIHSSTAIYGRVAVGVARHVVTTLYILFPVSSAAVVANGTLLCTCQHRK